MKKLIGICLAAVLVLTVAGGFALLRTHQPSAAVGAPNGKVVVNFEGMVAAVDGNEVTLESGKVIIITEDTVFAGDPDTGNAVSSEIAAGNFIQGYTKDDPESDCVSASKVWFNAAPQRGGGKIVVNFEGTIASVEKGRITLESGQVVLVSDDTVFSIPSGVVKNVILSKGDRIQGHTFDDSAAAEITASRIHIIMY